MSQHDGCKYVVGVPVKLLQESVGFTCTVETKNGALYRGLVINVEDCFNIQMKNVEYTDKSGKKSSIHNSYIRGSQVMYVVLPDMFKNSANLQSRESLTQYLDEEKKKKQKLVQQQQEKEKAQKQMRD